MKKRMLSALLAVCMMLTLLPTTALAVSEPTSLLRAIQNYGLTATWDGANTVTVSGTKENATNFLKLDIPGGIDVKWEANLTGNVAYMYGLVELTSSTSQQFQGGDFYIEEGGSIENTGGRALGVSSELLEGAKAKPVYVSIMVNGGTIRAYDNHAIDLGAGGDARRHPIMSHIYISGGLVETIEKSNPEFGETTNKSAIYYPSAYDGGSVAVNGGVVRTDAYNTSTIYVSSANFSSSVYVNGGLVETGVDGNGIETNGEVLVGTSEYVGDAVGGIVVGDTGILHRGFQTKVTVGGGIVFGRFPILEVDDAEYIVEKNGTLIKHAVAYTDDKTYNAGSSDKLEIEGATVTATWSRQDEVSGIAYQKGEETGFFGVPGVTVVGTVLSERKLSATANQTKLTLDSGQTAQITITDNAASENPSYVYSSSDTNVVTVDTSGTVTPVGKGQATVTVTSPATSNYKEGSATVEFEVTKLPPQDVNFEKPGDQTATYGDQAFTNAATNNTSGGGGAITYSSSDENVATVDANGQVTIVGAGTATITATAAAVEGYAETPASYTLTVNPKEITATATVQDKTYDGTTAAEAAVTFDGLVSGESLTEDTDYTVEAVFADADAGENKNVNVTITLLNKNYKLDGTPITATATISKATLPGMNTTLLMEQTASFKRALDLSTVAGLPEGETPTFTVQGPGSDYQGLESAVVEANTLTLTTKADGTYDSGDTVTVSVTGMKNYEDSAITVQVTYTNKIIVAISGVTIEEKTYDGTAVTYTGEPTATKLSDGTEVTDEITYDYAYYKIGEEGALTEAPKDAGSYKLVISVAESNETYTGTVEIPFTIDPAVITIKADDVTAHVGDSVPTLTAYTVTGLVEGEALATEPTLTYVDAEGNSVTPDMSKEGTYTIQASGAAVPEGGNYQEQITYETGTLTVSARPVTPDDGDDDNGSSNSGGTTYTATVNKTGNGDVSVSPRNAKKGDKVTITVDPDAGYEVESVTVTDNSGKTIAVSNEGNGKYTFTQPGSRVAIQVTFRNTTEQPGDTVPFTDVASSEWYYEAVQYVYNNELMNGMSATTFEPNSTTTRGMIVTMLYRLENEPAAASAGFTDVAAGQWYTDAVNWAAANNIVNGYGDDQFGPTDTITREQMMAILYRYAQYKGYDVTASADLSAYTDAANISSYAVSAMQWAVGEGLINGVTNTTLVPGGSATRAQVAAILMRFCENVAK